MTKRRPKASKPQILDHLEYLLADILPAAHKDAQHLHNQLASMGALDGTPEMEFLPPDQLEAALIALKAMTATTALYWGPRAALTQDDALMSYANTLLYARAMYEVLELAPKRLLVMLSVWAMGVLGDALEEGGISDELSSELIEDPERTRALYNLIADPAFRGVYMGGLVVYEATVYLEATKQVLQI